MKTLHYIAVAFVLCAVAVLARLVLAPYLLQLPDDYFDETAYLTHARYRESLSSPWQTINIIGRRVDQVLITTGSYSIIQSDLQWTSDSGMPIFESSGTYGVDRKQKSNMSQYGNRPRAGQFLFPRHTQKQQYEFWDSMYIGARTASFVRVDRIGGLPVYVFNIVGSGMDETEGITHLSFLPQRPKVHTDGDSWVWVEPVSGLVVDYQEKGTSYFVSAETKERLGDFWIWQDRFTDDTKAAKFNSAVSARRMSLLVEDVLPAGFLVAGLLVLLAGILAKRKTTKAWRPHTDAGWGAPT